MSGVAPVLEPVLRSDKRDLNGLVRRKPLDPVNASCLSTLASIESIKNTEAVAQHVMEQCTSETSCATNCL